MEGKAPAAPHMTIVQRLDFFFHFFRPPATAKPWQRTLLLNLPILLFCVGLYRFFTHQWRAIDPGKPALGTRRRQLFIDGIAGLGHLRGIPHPTRVCWRSPLVRPLVPKLMASSNGELYSFAWWSGWRMIGYVLIPSLAILLMPGQRWRDYHVASTRAFSNTLGFIYYCSR